MRKMGVIQPEGYTGYSFDEVRELAAKIGYPVLVRPSYVLGGRGMEIVHNEQSYAIMGTMHRRTFLHSGLAVAFATPLLAALKESRWDGAADILEKATASGQVTSAALHVSQRGESFTRAFGKAPTGDAMTRDLPVIMLTARTDPVDIVLGLELGADDYVTKPFGVRELVARVRAVLRRQEREESATDSPGAFTFRGLHINFASCTVTVNGKKVELSALEFRLLQLLAGRPGRVYSRDQLLDRVWGDEAFVEPRTVDVHVSRLRAAIEPDKENPRYILTVRGMGYKFADPN